MTTKVVILAGGLGTRLSELTGVLPKPMVDVGGRPIIWHIMKYFSQQGYTDFVIACGYKGALLKKFFLDFNYADADFTVNLRTGEVELHSSNAEHWRVTLVDTGQETMTGGRLKRLKPYLQKRFLLTYGDGLSDVDTKALVRFHEERKNLLTLTAVQPQSRYGKIQFDERDNVLSFSEKPKGDGDWINGGFMVVEPEFLDYISGDDVALENEPFTQAVLAGKLGAYRHFGFWHCMDSLRDNQSLNAIWSSGNVPWKKW